MSAGIEFDVALPGQVLEAGGLLPSVRMRGWTAGPSAGEVFNDGPVVLLIHALTGEADASTWWGPLIGPGRAIDTDIYRVVSFNNLGGCYGSTGPGDDIFPRSNTDARLPAAVTTWDQARAILLGLDALGVSRVHLAAGGSLGGMITLALSVLDPVRFARIAPIAACAAAPAWIIGWNHVARTAVLSDPTYPVAEHGLSLARQIGMLTYRAEPGLTIRQGRACSVEPWTGSGPYRVQTYLEHQGHKLVRRFTAPAYLVQLGAMDHHDASRWPGDGFWRGVVRDETWGTARISSATLAIGISTDQLYAPQHSRALVDALTSRGVPAEYAEIDSLHGHDGFLIEWEQLEGLLRRALELPESPAPLVGAPGPASE